MVRSFTAAPETTCGSVVTLPPGSENMTFELALYCGTICETASAPTSAPSAMQSAMVRRPRQRRLARPRRSMLRSSSGAAGSAAARAARSVAGLIDVSCFMPAPDPFFRRPLSGGGRPAPGSALRQTRAR